MFTMPGMPAVPPHSQQIHHFPTLGLIFITIDHHPLLFKEINTYGMLEPFVIMWNYFHCFSVILELFLNSDLPGLIMTLCINKKPEMFNHRNVSWQRTIKSRVIICNYIAWWSDPISGRTKSIFLMMMGLCRDCVIGRHCQHSQSQRRLPAGSSHSHRSQPGCEAGKESLEMCSRYNNIWHYDSGQSKYVNYGF